MKTIANKISAVFLIIGVLFLNSVNAQKVKSISPLKGGISGGTTVIIKGSGFTTKKLESIIFGSTGVLVSSNNVKSDSIILVKSPVNANPPLTGVPVEVVFNGKTCTNKPKFFYQYPSVTGFSPDTVSTKGNQIIKIKGSYFSGANYVNFGAAGSQPINVTDTLVTVKTPAHVAKSVSVSVEVHGYKAKAPQKIVYWDKPKKNKKKKKTIVGSYTLSLENLTGLGPNYKVYVLGYSTGSKKILTVNADKQGVFTKVKKKNGFVESYELGTDITSIQLSNTNPIIGARIYFFVANTSKTYKDNSGKTGNGNLGFSYSNYGVAVNQVSNPPQSDFPQYSYIEPTFESGQGLFMDVSMVDGFFFPLSLIAEDAARNELGRVGQNAGISAEQVSNAYKPFMKKYNNSTAYNDLSVKADKNLTVLVNPGLYLASKTSALEKVFDDALNTLFTDASLNMNIWQKDKKGNPYFFNVKPKSGVTFPGTTNTHDALEFTASGLSESLYVFNPVGFSVVSYEDSQTNKRLPIKGSIKKGILTFETPLPSSVGILEGMYVSNASCAANTEITITGITKNSLGEIVSLNVNTAPKCVIKTTQFKFSKAPTNYYQSSGQMTFAGSGLFADGAIRYPNNANLQVILNGLENQLSTALNRGVALTKAVGNDNGRTTTLWGKETSWYPLGVTQNLFSYFMHTATVKGVNIFSLPAKAAKSAQGTKMAQAYGFSYDENPIEFIKTNQPPVPSEFTGTYPDGTTQLKLVLGPWLHKKKQK